MRLSDENTSFEDCSHLYILSASLFPQTISQPCIFSSPQGCHITSPKYAVATSISTFPASYTSKPSLGCVYRNPICSLGVRHTLVWSIFSSRKSSFFPLLSSLNQPPNYWYSSHARYHKRDLIWRWRSSPEALATRTMGWKRQGSCVSSFDYNGLNESNPISCNTRGDGGTWRVWRWDPWHADMQVSIFASSV